MNKPPAFQFYPDDYLGGTRTMTLAQKGAYMDLLCLQWSQGSIHKDDFDFVCQTLSIDDKAKVMRKFNPIGVSVFQNERLENERQKQIAYREKQSAKGQASVKARLNRGSTVVGVRFQPEVNSPSPSPSPSPILTHTHTAEVPTWDEVKTAAGMTGVPEASAKAFFDHHEGNSLWVNQHGAAINWRHKLKAWSERDRTAKPTEQPKSDGPTLAEVKAHAANKHGQGPATNYAASFWQFWNAKQWKKNGKKFDWQLAFDMSYNKHRAEKETQ